jgi:hypothetical protein
MKHGLRLALLLLLALAVGGAAVATDVGDTLVKTAVVGVAVSAVAGPANDGINRLVNLHQLPPGVATKVVPMLSVGEKGYVGAAQVAGAQNLVSQVKAALQFETAFDNKQYRIKLVTPINSVNPIAAKRVRGVGITGLLDIALSSNAYLLPPSEGWNAGDALKAGAIALAANQFGPQINSFIVAAFHTQGGLPDGATKVVPYLSFGSKAYIGMMQVAGPAAAVARVKAVWQLEQLFDGGRVRLRALAPSDSLNPLQLHRVKGVGCTAVIDAMVLRAREAERHPREYLYFTRAPVFVGLGEDPLYRPPGWDRGRKEGWASHGNPYLPPGQAKKVTPPSVNLKPPLPLAKPGVSPPAPKTDDEPPNRPDRGKGRGRGRGRH